MDYQCFCGVVLLLSVIRHVWTCTAITCSNHIHLCHECLFTFFCMCSVLGMHREIYAYNAVAVL